MIPSTARNARNWASVPMRGWTIFSHGRRRRKLDGMILVLGEWQEVQKVLRPS